jgi:plasmid maintenance system antidote protein VapI
MKVDTKQIEWLLKNASGYQIAKMSGVAQPTISALINKKRSVENLTIETGHKLTELANQMQETP